LDKKKAIDERKKQVGLIQISVNNAVKQLNDGKVVQAAIIDDLFSRKERLQAEIQALESGETVPAPAAPVESGIGIPQHLRISRSYTMSDEAKLQRSNASKSKKKSAGMKGNKNNWKHGKYAKSYIDSRIKPCKSTCHHYPCEIVADGGTKPGGVCLDKAEVLTMYQAILAAIKDKKNVDDFNELTALTLAEQMKVLHMLLEDVQRDGTIMKREKLDKDGRVIGYDIVPHPSLLTLPKMIADLGITPREMLISPKAIADDDNEEKEATTLATMLSRIGRVKPEGDKG
jgi:hypothetical protein